MFAVQLARLHGAHVITTAAAQNRDLLSSLGAEQIIDYRASRFEESVKDVDVALTWLEATRSSGPGASLGLAGAWSPWCPRRRTRPTRGSDKLSSSWSPIRNSSSKSPLDSKADSFGRLWIP